MKRTRHKGALVLVEGESDKRFFRQRFTRDSVAFEVAEGRDNVIGAIRILNADDFAGGIGIVDADFDNITGARLSEPNLFQTDLHDLECVLCQSPALAKVVREFASDDKLAAFVAKFGGDTEERFVCFDCCFCCEFPICFCWRSKRHGNTTQRFSGNRYPDSG